MIDIERLKSSLNIVDVIDKYVPLKKTGKNYQACCPFHTEKSPSFTVSEDKQFFHCFGCGEHGDVVKFVEIYSNVDFIEAARMLGGEDELTMADIKSRQKVNRLRLPVNGRPHSEDEINAFLGRCEFDGDVCFYDRYQVINLTDIHSNSVSIGLIEGRGFPFRPFKKDFIYGSCFIFGKIDQQDDIYLCEDYHDSLSVNKLLKLCSVSFFDPLNLYFIAQDLKRINKNIIVITSTEEGHIQADKLNLLHATYKELRDGN